MNNRYALHFILLTAFLTSSFVALNANAQQLSEADKKEAMKHFEEGQEQVKNGEFDGAYRSFLAGYQISGKPLFLFNMAECSRELGNQDRAIRDYEMYLSQEPNGTMSTKAKERLSELKASTPSQNSVTEDASAEVSEPGSQAEAQSSETNENTVTAVDRSITPDEGESNDDGGSFFTSAPFWIGVGVVVVAGSVTAIALAASSGDPSCEGSCVDLRNSF